MSKRDLQKIVKRSAALRLASDPDAFELAQRASAEIFKLKSKALGAKGGKAKAAPLCQQR